LLPSLLLVYEKDSQAILYRADSPVAEKEIESRPNFGNAPRAFQVGALSNRVRIVEGVPFPVTRAPMAPPNKLVLGRCLLKPTARTGVWKEQAQHQAQ